MSYLHGLYLDSFQTTKNHQKAFHGDRSTRLLVIAIFASVRKDEEEEKKKNEEKKTKLWQLVSRK